MKFKVVSRGVIVAVAAALSGCNGCYGLAGLSVDGESRGAEAASDVAAHNGPLVPGKAQLRLLNGVEYRSTVRDLLGVEAGVLGTGELAAGYDTGAGGRVDENTLSALLAEGERVATAYVAERISSDFACFNPADVKDECVAQIIQELGARAYRRPLNAESAASLEAFFARVATELESRPVAVEFLIARILTSPQFLYRTEVGVALLDGDGARGLDGYERASLISYAITGSMPDALLMKDAASGALVGEKIREHVRRLLVTPAGKARLVAFFKQWLRVGSLDAMAQDASKFPKLSSAEQGVALRGEFETYVTSVVFNGEGTLPSLLKDNSTFVNKHTASLYGLTSQSESALDQVWLDPTQRKGVLTLASVLAAHSSNADPTADRPVRRGLLVLNRVLCDEVGPPSGINTAAASSNAAAQTSNFNELTTREQYEAMMEQGAECKSCHRQFMPLGFAFGQFDALGRHVTAKGSRTINPAISEVPIKGEPKTFSGATSLIDEVSALPATSTCFTRNFVTYTVGTPSGVHVDALTLELSAAFATNHYDIKKLIEDTLASPHLYVRRSE